MSNKEFDKYIKEFKRYSKMVTSSEEANRKFLVNLGILTPKGNPTKKFLKLTSEK
jgi:hypothetical protein